MTTKSIGWILKFTAELPNKEEKIKCLRANDNHAIKTVLKHCFDPNIKWDLPEGAPPYEPLDEPHQEGRLYSEVRTFYVFVEGGPNVPKLRKETMFVELLESIAPEDAELMIGVKDKKLPFKGLTRKIVKEAFPGLIED